MKDKYLYFKFNGIDSSEFNCFIENGGEDLLYPAFPEFSDSKESPMFQKRSYYLGTTLKDRTFPFTLACEEITYSRFKQMQRWLNIESIGELYLDFVPDFHWNVKISSISNIKLLPLQDNKTKFHCEFDIAFTTITDYAAISNITYSFTGRQLDNGSLKSTVHLDRVYRLPVIDYNPTLPDVDLYQAKERYRLFNFQEYECYPSIELQGTNNLDIKLLDNEVYFNKNISNWPNTTPWYKYQLNKSVYDLSIKGQVGYVINNNTNQLIEDDYLDALSQDNNIFMNNGGFNIKPGNLQQETLKLVKIAQGVVKGDKTLQALHLTFSGDSISRMNQLYDFGRIKKDEEGNIDVFENTNCKSIFIQTPGYDDYLLYNEGSFNDGKYYINEQYVLYSYCFYVDNGYLELYLCNIGQDWYDEDGQLVQMQKYLANRLNQDFIVSICNYTEIDINSWAEINENIQHSINTVKFNYRTVF